MLMDSTGRGIHVKSPEGTIIKPGQTIVVRNEGMPTFKRPDQKGNLYVVMEVEFPENGWLSTIDAAVSMPAFLSCGQI
jgi:DnaJ family protein A protein 2